MAAVTFGPKLPSSTSEDDSLKYSVSTGRFPRVSYPSDLESFKQSVVEILRLRKLTDLPQEKSLYNCERAQLVYFILSLPNGGQLLADLFKKEYPFSLINIEVVIQDYLDQLSVEDFKTASRIIIKLAPFEIVKILTNHSRFDLIDAYIFATLEKRESLIGLIEKNEKFEEIIKSPFNGISMFHFFNVNT